MKITKTLLRNYARLAVRKGLNIQKGQGVQIFASVQQHEFATLCAQEAYRAGAAWVSMEWSCQDTTRLAYKHENIKTLTNMPQWKKEKYQYLAQELPCRLHILSENPDGLKGVRQDKVTKTQVAAYPVLEPYRRAIDNRHQWCIIGAPCAAWAKKVFPHLKKQAAINALWQAILHTARVTGDAAAAAYNPETAWDAHNAALARRCEHLNALGLESLHITTGLGTDLTVCLMQEGRFEGGGETTEQGVFYNPNMPTEEIFTTPKRGLAQGVVVSSKPLSYQGRMIEDFSLTFEAGKVVKSSARVGADILETLLASDEGARCLGEVALVPFSSPINQSGLLFYNTLYDENAACHLALGRGFDNIVKDYSSYTYDQLTEMGVNRSMIHIDFMIGTADTRIIGKNAQGEHLLFENGEWAFHA